MKITQRQSVLGVLSLITVINLLLIVAMLIPSIARELDRNLLVAGAVSLVILGALLAAYWRGWQPARYIVVIYLTTVIAFATPEPFVTGYASLTLFAPPALALILAEPIWVAGSAAMLYLILLARAGGEGAYANPITLLLAGIVVGSMIAARLVTDTALQLAREHARQTEEQRRLAETQARELSEANELMNTQLDHQQQLLSLVATLETPVVTLADGVLFAPVVGHIDSRRSQVLMTRLLQVAAEQRAQLVILDISGVSMMDTLVAKALLDTSQALRLLGCDVTLSGISASIAMTLIGLGISLEGIATARSPQEALAHHYSIAASSESNRNGKSAYN
jgi:rsbT co-antagonist protein RsbR